MINTNKGLYQYTRLHFMIASATVVFHRITDTILQGIEGVAIDTLMTSSLPGIKLH